jgi:hypothetical protein
MPSPGFDREIIWPSLLAREATRRDRADDGTLPMNDLLWLAVLAGLVLATLAYVRLCEKA